MSLNTLINQGMNQGIETSMGRWNPLIFLIAFIAVIIIVFIIRSFGNRHYDKHDKSGQAKPFASGNVDYTQDNMGASNIYWGFFDALNWLYRPMTAMHTGIINDYLGIFFIVIAIVMVLIILI